LKGAAYTGRLTKIERVEDIYEKKPSPKIKIRMQDAGGEVAQITFTLKGYFTLEFFQRIGAINLAKPFTLSVYGSKNNDKVSYCSLRQFGKKIEPDKGFPEPTKVKVDDADITDWSSMTAAVTKAIAEITEKLTPLVNAAETAPLDEPPAKEDDLPF
jgi:hypothetical protein